MKLPNKMKNFTLAFLGIFTALALSWYGLIVVNQDTVGQLEPTLQYPEEGVEEAPLGESLYPLRRSGIANQGERVYANLGCVNCHTQQVRATEMGYDITSKSAPRASVARDYIRDNHPMLGTVRMGPDLRHVGGRITDANTLHLILFDSRLVAERSFMPSYAYLYEVRDLAEGEVPSADALTLPENADAVFAAQYAGKQVVPTAEAKMLVAYLQSLKLDYVLPEAPVLEEE